MVYRLLVIVSITLLLVSAPLSAQKPGKLETARYNLDLSYILKSIDKKLSDIYEQANRNVQSKKFKNDQEKVEATNKFIAEMIEDIVNTIITNEKNIELLLNSKGYDFDSQNLQIIDDMHLLDDKLGQEPSLKNTKFYTLSAPLKTLLQQLKNEKKVTTNQIKEMIGETLKLLKKAPTEQDVVKLEQDAFDAALKSLNELDNFFNKPPIETTKDVIKTIIGDKADEVTEVINIMINIFNAKKTSSNLKNIINQHGQDIVTKIASIRDNVSPKVINFFESKQEFEDFYNSIFEPLLELLQENNIISQLAAKPTEPTAVEEQPTTAQPTTQATPSAPQPPVPVVEEKPKEEEVPSIYPKIEPTQPTTTIPAAPPPAEQPKVEQQPQVEQPKEEEKPAETQSETKPAPTTPAAEQPAQPPAATTETTTPAPQPTTVEEKKPLGTQWHKVTKATTQVPRYLFGLKVGTSTKTDANKTIKNICDSLSGAKQALNKQIAAGKVAPEVVAQFKEFSDKIKEIINDLSPDRLAEITNIDCLQTGIDEIRALKDNEVIKSSQDLATALDTVITTIDNFIKKVQTQPKAAEEQPKKEEVKPEEKVEPTTEQPKAEEKPAAITEQKPTMETQPAAPVESGLTYYQASAEAEKGKKETKEFEGLVAKGIKGLKYLFGVKEEPKVEKPAPKPVEPGWVAKGLGAIKNLFGGGEEVVTSPAQQQPTTTTPPAVQVPPPTEVSKPQEVSKPRQYNLQTALRRLTKSLQLLRIKIKYAPYFK